MHMYEFSLSKQASIVSSEGYNVDEQAWNQLSQNDKHYHSMYMSN